jgi:hypothetical protein
MDVINDLKKSKEMLECEIDFNEDSILESVFNALGKEKVLIVTAGQTIECKYDQLIARRKLGRRIFSRPRTLRRILQEFFLPPTTLTVQLKIGEFDVVATCLA